MNNDVQLSPLRQFLHRCPDLLYLLTLNLSLLVWLWTHTTLQQLAQPGAHEYGKLSLSYPAGLVGKLSPSYPAGLVTSLRPPD